jgi:hypothetical protein
MFYLFLLECIIGMYCQIIIKYQFIINLPITNYKKYLLLKNLLKAKKFFVNSKKKNVGFNANVLHCCADDIFILKSIY